MKGWEVYVWKVDEGWHYSLLVGTNRNKTAAEIFDAAPPAPANSEFPIAVDAPLADVRSSLSRLASHEFVSVLGVQRRGADEFEVVSLSDEIINALRELCAELDLQMN